MLAERNTFTRWIIAGVYWMLAVALTPANAAEKPNILFLFTDDQRPDTIAALGNPAIQTPNLDRLVEQGLVFHNAYCMGSTEGAVCLPSRTMMLSGRSVFHIKPQSRRAKYEVNFPKSMKEAGYVTYHHGKSGNTPHGIHADFDYTKYLENDQQERLSGYPGKEISDAAIQFLEQYQDEKPFFMYLAFGNPHDPRVANDEYREKYRDDNIPLPKNFMPLHPFDNGEMAVRDEQLAPWPRTKADARKQLADYYAVTTYLDMEIGRILDTLKRLGKYENTIIIFSSDHGLAMGSHGLMGKQNLYEHSMQAPLIFAGPGIPKGETDALIYLFDIFPTVCELVGAPAPKGIDGKSFASVIRDPKSAARETIFLAYKDVQRAIRQGKWKLYRYPQVNVTQLFDVEADPDELHDVSKQHPEVVAQLMKQLAEQQSVVGDPHPLEVPEPKPAAITVEQLNRLRKK